jgi:hypothetical protein
MKKRRREGRPLPKFARRRSLGVRTGGQHLQVSAGIIGLHIIDTAPNQAVDLAAGHCFPGEECAGDAPDQLPMPADQRPRHGTRPRLELLPWRRAGQLPRHELDSITIVAIANAFRSVSIISASAPAIEVTSARPVMAPASGTADSAARRRGPAIAWRYDQAYIRR